MGLGNPGPEYAPTRHNAGFRLVDSIREAWAFPPFAKEGRARVSVGRRHDQDVRLIKPHTYMNRSGAAVTPYRSDPDFDPSRDLLVLVDDVAVPLGRFRLRAQGSAGGHNGLRSIEGALMSPVYPRLRIGVGPRPEDWDDLADFVLDAFEPEETTMFEAAMAPMVEAVDCWLVEGIDTAMNRFNRSLEEM
ncbi:MAG: aminoacyl-tRNA hydrolase [Gemmatimonadales bacterium]